MNAALDFFAGGPARLKALLVGVLAGLVVLLAVAAIALWWRGEALQARGERDLAIAQAQVLAKSVKVCSDGVDQAKRAADTAVALGGRLLAAASQQYAGARKQAQRIEEILKRPTPAGAGCEEAWDAIEADRASQTKARGPR